MPKIAVITPYHQEPLDQLAQCHQSVLAQQPQADHIMVADGFAHTEVSKWNVQHVVLPRNHKDFGSTPRGIGALLADSQGYDFVAFLDADNWFEPGHLASLLELHARTGASVSTSFRNFRRPDGTALDITEREEDSLLHVDTNCLMLHRSAFQVLPVWIRMHKNLGPLCDRVFLAALRHARIPIASTQQRTVAYRTLHELHYTQAGLPPPPGFKSGQITRPSIEWLQTRQGIDDCLQRLGFWPLTFIRG